jgi:acetate kinase
MVAVPVSRTVLVLNAGSSSMKFAVVVVPSNAAEGDPATSERTTSGSVEDIGRDAVLSITTHGRAAVQDRRHIQSHAEATRWALEALGAEGSITGLDTGAVRFDAVGHRVVHGGDQFHDAVRIDESVVREIERLTELAPLHNAAALEGIRTARQILGDDLPMAAVFDTGFYRNLPACATTYAIPHELATRHQIRRYGFHGTAHASLTAGYAAVTGRRLDDVRLITLHLGNGCSATAISRGRAVDTSMGLTPLEGLVMGTRAGDLDPAIVGYLARREHVGVDQVERWLNERSGLLGVSGLSHDMRTLLAAVEESNDPNAALAVELFCYRVRKYIGAYFAVLGGADAIVFGGGIGERAPNIRARICGGMDWCGVRLDPQRNAAAVDLGAGQGARISRDDAPVGVYVVAADEERWIARETVRCLQGAHRLDT